MSPYPMSSIRIITTFGLATRGVCAWLCDAIPTLTSNTAANPPRWRINSPLARERSMNVPTGHQDIRRRSTEVADVVARCQCARLARQERDVVVLPQYRQCFLTALPRHLKAQEERNRLPRIG